MHSKQIRDGFYPEDGNTAFFTDAARNPLETGLRPIMLSLFNWPDRGGLRIGQFEAGGSKPQTGSVSQKRSRNLNFCT